MCKNRVNYVENASDSSDDNHEVLGMIHINGIQKELCEGVQINEKIIDFKLDTGSDCNVLPLKIVKKLNMEHKIDRNGISNLYNYDGSKINSVGKLKTKEDAKRYGHDYCVITFDQPLYAKAREIVSAAPEESDLSKIIVRLGGFYLLMSFFGAIGYIMQGSGIKEVLSLIYAPYSLEKMLNGHAYARAVRAHTLLHLTLATIISKELVLDSEIDENLTNTIELIMAHLH
ncbi:hypothetical protein ACJJTC_016034 [Scirpophaga incertulas]